MQQEFSRLDLEQSNKTWWTFANLGDSQAHFIDTLNNQTFALTQPESIQDPREQKRLFDAHPEEKHEQLYQRNSYVLGRVQPTSVIGDFHLKESLHNVRKFFDPVVGKNNTRANGYYLTPPYLHHTPTLTRFHLDVNEYIEMRRTRLSPTKFVIFETSFPLGAETNTSNFVVMNAKAIG